MLFRTVEERLSRGKTFFLIFSKFDINQEDLFLSFWNIMEFLFKHTKENDDCMKISRVDIKQTLPYHKKVVWYLRPEQICFCA